jgi:hypothetical protein
MLELMELPSIVTVILRVQREMTPVMPKRDNATANVTSKETNVTLVPLTIMVFLTVTNVNVMRWDLLLKFVML